MCIGFVGVSTGNSVKFSARSAKECMEWVVAVKEAIRVLEEKEREAVSLFLFFTEAACQV